jgi:hypothetical protein
MSRARHRVTVAEAADILGITAETVRTRIKRGRLDSVKEPPGPGGTVYVLLLQADQTGPNYDPTSRGQDRTDDQTPSTAVVEAKDETIEALRERVRRLEHELDIRNDEIRRRDHLLAAALERIPAIEAPPEERESREGAEPQSARGTPTEEQEESTSRPLEEQRSWWRRMFGT